MENLGGLLRLFADMRPPKTPFGKAMSYAEGQWPAMMRYPGRHPQKDILDLTPRDWRDARAQAAGAAVPPD